MCCYYGRRAFAAWESKHVSYKLLKKLIKSVVAAAPPAPVAMTGIDVKSEAPPKGRNEVREIEAGPVSGSAHCLSLCAMCGRTEVKSIADRRQTRVRSACGSGQLRFLYALCREAMKVNTFYQAKVSEYERRFQHVLTAVIQALPNSVATNGALKPGGMSAAATAAAISALLHSMVITTPASAQSTGAEDQKSGGISASASAALNRGDFKHHSHAAARAGSSAGSGSFSSAISSLSQSSLQRSLAAINELRVELEQLRSYVILNSIACYKILKKYVRCCSRSSWLLHCKCIG